MDYIQIGLLIFASLVLLLTVIYYVSYARRNKKSESVLSVERKTELESDTKSELKSETKLEVKPDTKSVITSEKKSEIKIETSSESESKASESKAVHKETRRSVPTGPRQITLYEFPYDSGIQICPGCDAENQHSYRFCWICGYKMP